MSQRKFAVKVRQQMNANLHVNIITIKKMLKDRLELFNQKQKLFNEGLVLGAYLFDQYKIMIEQMEAKGESIPGLDCFLSEKKYLSCTVQMLAAIDDLK